MLNRQRHRISNSEVLLFLTLQIRLANKSIAELISRVACTTVSDLSRSTLELLINTSLLVTAMLLAEAAETLLQDDLQLPGGIYTAACMGQRYIDRLEKSGFKFETKIISA